MIVQQVQDIDVPLTETEVLRVVDAAGTVGRLFVLENLDTANTLTFKWQKSGDGSTFQDITGLPQDTISPGLAKTFRITEPDQFLRLLASGNLRMQIGAMRSSVIAPAAIPVTLPLVIL